MGALKGVSQTMVHHAIVYTHGSLTTYRSWNLPSPASVIATAKIRQSGLGSGAIAGLNAMVGHPEPVRGRRAILLLGFRYRAGPETPPAVEQPGSPPPSPLTLRHLLRPTNGCPVVLEPVPGARSTDGYAGRRGSLKTGGSLAVAHQVPTSSRRTFPVDASEDGVSPRRSSASVGCGRGRGS